MKPIISLVERITPSAMVRTVRELFVTASRRAKRENIVAAFVILESENGGYGYEVANMTTKDRLIALETVKQLIIRDSFL